MMKGLSEEEKKLIGDYISEQKTSGKSEQQIVKEASSKALLFVCCMMFIVVFGSIFIFIILNGQEQEFMDGMQKIVDTGEEFIHWNFPKMAGQAAKGPASPIPEATGGASV